MYAQHMLLDFLDYARIRTYMLTPWGQCKLAPFQLVRIFLNVSGCCSVCLCLQVCTYGICSHLMLLVQIVYSAGLVLGMCALCTSFI